MRKDAEMSKCHREMSKKLTRMRVTVLERRSNKKAHLYDGSKTKKEIRTDTPPSNLQNANLLQNENLKI